jgi:hypothetical protein
MNEWMNDEWVNEWWISEWMMNEWMNDEWVNEWWMNRHTCNKSLAPMPVPSIDPIVTVKKGKCCINKKRTKFMKNVWMMSEGMN